MKRETDLLNLISTYITSWLDKPFKFSGPAILLALFFASCEEPLEAPSSKLVPNDNNTNLKYIELPLEASQISLDIRPPIQIGDSIVAQDTVISSNNVSGTGNIVYFGTNQGTLGRAKMKSFSGLSLQSNFNRESIESNASLVDVNLFMQITYLYGDSFDREFDIEVRRLAEDINIDRTYNIYDKLLEGTILNEENPIRIQTDSLLKSQDPSKIRISLSEVFGMELINLISDASLGNDELEKLLRGLSISSSDNGIFGLNTIPSSSFIQLAFKNEGGVNDTLNLNFTNSSFTNVDFEPAGLIPSNYSGDQSYELNDPSKIYFNSMLGIYPKVQLTNYLDFIDSMDYFLINRAELIIGSNIENIQSPTVVNKAPQNLFPYFWNEDRVLRSGRNYIGIQSNFTPQGGVSDQDGFTNQLRMPYFEDDSFIAGDVTLFLQEIFDDREFWNDQQDILLLDKGFGPDARFDTRPILTIGNYNNFLINSDDIKLRIYYTTFEN